MKLKNLKIAFRNILKNGIYSLINIVGLSLGTAVVVLILFWIIDEWNYDKYHEKLDKIFTIYEHQQYSEGQELFTNCTPFPLSKELVDNYAEVEIATTFTNLGEHLFKYNNKEFKEGSCYFVDNEFLNIFSFQIKEGDKNIFESPDKIMISEKLAKKLFGGESAINKVVTVDDAFPLTIGAVIVPKEKNSTIRFEALASIKFLEKNYSVNLERWGNNWPSTCVVLNDPKNAESFEAKITDLCKEKGQESTSFHVFPYKHERLYSYSGKNNRIQYIYQFLAVAFIIILIASINFINLSLARVQHRSPEVGIRKVNGAGRKDIFKQFLLEKGMMIFASLIVSTVLVIFLLPVFENVSDKQFAMSYLQNKNMVMMLLMVVILVMAISSLYPSMYLSSFNPVEAIKKLNTGKVSGLNMKNILVVVQFVLSIILISSTITIAQQIKFVNKYDLGYNQANLIYIYLTGEARNQHETLVQEFKKIPGIDILTLTNNLPFNGTSSSWGYDWEDKDPENKMLISQIRVDKNYFETMGISFIEGTTFSDTYDKVMNSNEVSKVPVVFNQEAIKGMCMKNPVGKYFRYVQGKEATISGVVEDFHFQSLHRGVEPLLIVPLFDSPENIIIRVNPENFTQTLEDIKKSWAGIIPGTACDIGFFDDRLERLYNSEIRISGLFKYFSFVAIFISCIGLFGLSLFIIERRKKEIGVRKVNGAKISEVMVMLNKDLILWVIISFIIATPIAWLIMNKWLENFAYKTKINWWIMASAGILALCIALFTVSWQSLRAARRNPVEALRYE